MGTVDSDPPPIYYLLPPVIQSGTIAKVFVNELSEVKEGDKLYEFEARMQKCDLERAKVGVEKAKHELAKAAEAKIQHEQQVLLLQEGVAIAETQMKFDVEKEFVVKKNLETLYSTSNFNPNDWTVRLAKDPDYLKARGDAITSRSKWELKKKELDQLKSVNISLLEKEAKIGVLQAEAELAKAQTAVDLCTVKAETPGIIEHLSISRGTTIGIGTPKPALWLIPAGPRIVRAEIEADFAHRVSSKLNGKIVTIYDNTDPKLTYQGKVLRISDTFLMKRSANETLLGTGTPILEAAIQVIDAAPANQPPLRVGQRVRVDLGQ
jgi:multidrug resistance efflux pump